MNNFVLPVIAIAIIGAGVFCATQTKAVSHAKDKIMQTVDPNAVTEWEHGWKTSRITATRYSNLHMGQSVGFTFPKNPNDCDLAELSDFIEAQGGSVYQSGGYPGAEMFAQFKGVKDKETANAKLKEILPAFNQLMQDITDGKKIAPIVNPNAKAWPDTDPPDKTDKYWELNNNLNANGTQYKKAEVSPGKWQWIVDEEAMKSFADMNAHRRNLFYALTHRVLTDAELKEALGYGDSLNVEPNVGYYAEEKGRELQRAFQLQETLRRMAAIPKL
jgi:hypothetical protein